MQTFYFMIGTVKYGSNNSRVRNVYGNIYIMLLLGYSVFYADILSDMVHF